MKFRSETRTRMVERTINGITHDVQEKYAEQVPVLPRDWDAVAVRVAAGIVLALTAVSVTWSTVSIGGLLGGGVGYAAAAIFDLAWLTVLLLEWLARYSAAKRAFPRRAGWALVALAAGAIAWHGVLAGSVALAVVGAAVSVISKLLWLAVFKFIDRPIGKLDAQWLAAEESRLSAQEAIATARLRAAAADERVTLKLLAAERVRADLAALSGAAPVTVEQLETVSGHAPSIETEHGASTPLSSADNVRTPDLTAPSIAELARAEVAAGLGDKEAAAKILSLRPDTSPDTVLRTIRRERKRTGGYL